jgi:hypothetical protein
MPQGLTGLSTTPFTIGWPIARRHVPVRHDQPDSAEPTGRDQAASGMAMDRLDAASIPRLVHVHSAGGALNVEECGQLTKVFSCSFVQFQLMSS